MTICYCFASAPAGVTVTRDQIKTTATNVAALLNRRFTPRALCAFLEYRGTEPPGSQQARYSYMLRFRYRSLQNVADIVLENRSQFSSFLDRTVTMLEYPDDEKETSHGATPDSGTEKDAVSPLIENVECTRGLLLVKENIKNRHAWGATSGFSSWKQLSDIARPFLVQSCADEPLCCTDVFGPYDYIVEFQASDGDKADALVKKLWAEPSFQNCVATMQWFFCDPFEP